MKGAKSNTFTWKLCDCTSHSNKKIQEDEDLFSFVTSALSEGSFNFL